MEKFIIKKICRKAPSKTQSGYQKKYPEYIPSLNKKGAAAATPFNIVSSHVYTVHSFTMYRIDS